MMAISCYTTAFIIAAPFVWYFVMWTQPKWWINFSEQQLKMDPSQAMYKIGMTCRVVLHMMVPAWWYITAATPVAFSEVPAWRLAAGLLAIIVGQILNAGVFRAIGIEGVFYGRRFGKKLPWVTTWPFGGPYSVRHPQYVGSCLTCVGLALFLYTPQHMEDGFMWVAMAPVVSWICAGIWEEYWP